ncbi:cytochrome P450 [Aspergillus insuetus]
MESVLSVGASFACLLLFVSVVYAVLLDPLRQIPGPFYARFTKLILTVYILKGQRTQYIHGLHLKYGPIVRVTPHEVAIADLDAFREIHRIGSGFQKAPWYLKFVTTPRPGMFAMTIPEEHAARRRIFAQGFANTSILQYEGIIRDKAELAVSKIQRDAEAGFADIFKWFTFMATDIAGHLSFGSSFDMLLQEQKTPYIRDLEITMKISGVRAELGWLIHFLGWFPLESLQEALSLPGRLQDYGMKAIENHKGRVLAGGGPPTSLFSKLLDPKQTHGLAMEDISIEASNMIIAGSDTTSVSLTYLVWVLLRPQNTKIKERVLQEIERLPPNPRANDMMGSEYLKAVVNEALRLYGAAPGSLPRVTPLPGAQLSGYTIPGGTTVSTQAFSIHRDPAYFPDPERFIPERWLDPTPKMKAAFHPFGAGSRVCIGMHLAMLELFTGLVVFFLNCPKARLSPDTTDESMEFENYFLVAPKEHCCKITLG